LQTVADKDLGIESGSPVTLLKARAAIGLRHQPDIPDASVVTPELQQGAVELVRTVAQIHQ
jgi:hypothetical protein